MIEADEDPHYIVGYLLTSLQYASEYLTSEEQAAKAGPLLPGEVRY